MTARILHIVTSLEAGGAQTSVVSIVCGLRRRGVDAGVVFSSRGGLMADSHGALRAELTAAGAPVHDLPAMRRAPSPWDAVALGQMTSLLRRLRPAAVHTHAAKAGLLGRLAAARAGVGVAVHTVRGWPFHGCGGARRAAYIRAERILAHLTDRLVAVSPAMVETGLAHAIGRPGDYQVIRSGIDLARFARRGVEERLAARRRLGLPEDAPVVGSVMRLVAAKAPLDLVAVAARVTAALPGARFVVAGDGPERPAMERAIARAGLSGFALLGERADVPDLLAAMDVFALTSHWEGMPRVVVEAAAAGVPIAATDVGGARDIVIDGSSGVLCPPGAVDALAAGILRLLREPAWARGLAAAAAARVTDDFDLAGVVDQHVALYAELGVSIAGSPPEAAPCTTRRGDGAPSARATSGRIQPSQPRGGDAGPNGNRGRPPLRL